MTGRTTEMRTSALVRGIRIGAMGDFFATSATEEAKGETDAGPGYWDRVADNFGERPFHLDSFLGHIKRDAYLRLIRRWAPGESKQRILKTDLFEEAFGPDALLMDLAPEAERVYAFDLSAETVRAASRRCNGLFAAGDVRGLPFAAEAFDLIISPSTLDHFPDPSDLGVSLKQLRRTLRPDGRLIVSLDNRHNIGAPLLRLAIWMGLIPFYMGKFYSVRELREELEAAGFRVLETTAIVQSPRLMAVGSVTLAKKLRWAFLQRLVQKGLLWMQRLETTWLRYYTGSFVAALAVKQEGPLAVARGSASISRTGPPKQSRD